MKILYVAEHDSQDNDDEGAISYCMEQLGHTVVKIDLRSAATEVLNRQKSADFVFFHKWGHVAALKKVKIPKVFWYFDLVDSNDERFKAISSTRRINWMQQVMPLVNLGFCTDGDWVAQDKTGKLIHLLQGADTRVAGHGYSTQSYPPIMFAGGLGHSTVRLNCLRNLQRRYRDKFWMLGTDSSNPRKHGRELADIFAGVKIVIAPPGLCTNRYWSNRVFLTLGLGGFLLHAWCERLQQFYKFGEELVCYKTQQELLDLIDYYLTHEDERERIRLAGHQRTMQDHTYMHRVKVLLEMVKPLCPNPY